MDAEQVSKGEEEHVTARVTILHPSPSVPRRHSPRNRRPPKKLSYELSQTVESEEDWQKVERGWKLSQKAKVRRAAGHM